MENKLYYLDSEANFEDSNKKEYIKLNSPYVLDIENYSTKVRNQGIVFEDINDNPFEKDI